MNYGIQERNAKINATIAKRQANLKKTYAQASMNAKEANRESIISNTLSGAKYVNYRPDRSPLWAKARGQPLQEEGFVWPIH